MHKHPPLPYQHNMEKKCKVEGCNNLGALSKCNLCGQPKRKILCGFHRREKWYWNKIYQGKIKV